MEPGANSQDSLHPSSAGSPRAGSSAPQTKVSIVSPFSLRAHHGAPLLASQLLMEERLAEAFARG